SSGCPRAPRCTASPDHPPRPTTPAATRRPAAPPRTTVGADWCPGPGFARPPRPRPTAPRPWLRPALGQPEGGDPTDDRDDQRDDHQRQNPLGSLPCHSPGVLGAPPPVNDAVATPTHVAAPLGWWALGVTVRDSPAGHPPAVPGFTYEWNARRCAGGAQRGV